LVVFEGIDGSGKTVQLKLLKKYLDSHHLPIKVIDFPRYSSSFHAKTIKKYLTGEFGSVESVNPYLISLVYALDRADAKKEMDSWLSQGRLVLANRYATSNMAHQATKLSPAKRKDFLNWEYELEYKVNKIPKEDLVLYLDIPAAAVQRLLRKRGGMNKDIHEKNIKFLTESEKMYKKLVKKYPHWVLVKCLDKSGTILSKETIHDPYQPQP